MNRLHSSPTISQRPWRWDLICRVIDNFGDAAVVWRLARQLSVEHDERVRLFIDRPAVLGRLVPGAIPGASVDGVKIAQLIDDAPADEPAQPTPAKEPAGAAGGKPRRAVAQRGAEGGDADVVVTGFHASLPAWYRERMRPGRPLWINLEYLSAEAWIDGFHGLPSPQPDGLTQHYFYPGFSAGSGGLLREADLVARREAFLREGEAAHFLADLGVHRRDGETLASVLCYRDAPLEALAHVIAESTARLHLVVPAGAAAGVDDEDALIRASRSRLRISRVPFLPQHDYDSLLWSCDFNFVRGEDSLVRAIWSARPFVWQIYPQDQGTHLPKLEAFLRLVPGEPLAGAMRWWNRVPGSTPDPMLRLVARPDTAAACGPLPGAQAAAPDLATRLLAFTDGLAAKVARMSRTPGKL